VKLTDHIFWDIPLSPNERRAFIAAIVIGALVLLALPSIGRLGLTAIGGLR